MAPFSAMLLIAALACSFLCVYRAMLFAAQLVAGRGAGLAGMRIALLERIKTRLLAWDFLSQKLQALAQRRHSAEMEAELPEVLRLLCTALESGSSLVMALRYAAQNCKDPLAGELKQTVWDIEAGQGFDEAIEGLRARTGGAEFAYLSVAMEIQHASGGSLTEILDTVSAMLRQSAQLKEELRTKTAQGRLSSRIVALMPFALLALFSVFSPGYLTEFFSSPLGVFLFILALLLEAAGVALVFRALKIDFSVDLEGGA